MSKVNQDPGNHQEDKKEVIIIKDDLWDRGLPTELLELILSKLIFVVDIHKFHAVCETWRSITVRDSPPRQLPSPLLYADSSFPLFFQGNPQGDSDYSKYRVMHPLYKYTWDLEFPPQVGDGPKTVIFSKYGWSLMARSYWHPFLFNPLTQEIKELPTFPFFPGYTTCMLFTCPPSQPEDCLVVAISGLDRSIFVHKLGEADWKKHDLNGKMASDFHPDCHPILYQGLYYCLDVKGNLAVFDIQDIEHTWIVHDTVIPSRGELLTALVEHNGQFLVVSIGFHPPCIFELDLKTKLYTPMHKSLGKNALFISNGASFSQKAIRNLLYPKRMDIALFSPSSLFSGDSDGDEEVSVDEEKADNHQSYVERKHQFPGMELLIREFSFHQFNANLLWPGTFAFAEWLVQHQSWIQGRRCLELGSGTGALAIFLRKSFDLDITTSDYDDQEIEDNIAQNCEANGITPVLPHIRHSWGDTFPTTEPDWDLIIASDILLYVKQYRNLIKSLSYLLKSYKPKDDNTVPPCRKDQSSGNIYPTENVIDMSRKDRILRYKSPILLICLYCLLLGLPTPAFLMSWRRRIGKEDESLFFSGCENAGLEVKHLGSRVYCIHPRENTVNHPR
ncbi:Nicotinamide N-methyltransferase-like protein [Corchorus capsularis]|uniref:Nicotinamide N-methyltransferase-like protein n=1 Tax=Corchorus capsularis TaxID=210143 RepID=A0A1R3KWX1_COCAP|nr:Nicotinamide N-methyltransferase-like protein [Corchorus capsularis]